MAKTIRADARTQGTAERLPPLVMQIADQIEREIIAGRYSSGEWLREQEIADRLGTSRGPVREALRLVELDGLVEMVPWRGARVVEVSAAALDDLMEVLASLQGLVARLAAVHADDAGFDQVEALVEDMNATIVHAHPMGQQLRLAFEAGALMRELCGSQRAGSMLMKVGRLAYWQHRYLLGADLRWRRATIRKWRTLVTALRARDGDRADRAARDMVHHSKAYIMTVLQRDAVLPLPDELPARMESVGMR